MRLIILLATLVLATPALADDPNTATDQAAACIISRDATRAVAMARALPGTIREDALIGEAMPILTACLGSDETRAQSPRFTRVLGRVAELLYVGRGKTISFLHLDPKVQDRLGVAQFSLERTKDWPLPTGTVVCAILRDTMKAEVLIRTVHGSVKEDQALAAFTALLPPCLPAGAMLHATPVQLRAIVARARLSDNFEDDLPPVATR